MADFALHEMLSRPNHTVVYASASLLLAQELPIKTAMRANQTISQIVEGDAAILKVFADSAQAILNATAEGTRNPHGPSPHPDPLPSHQTLLR